MARLTTSTELSVLADRGRLVQPVRLEIQNASGTWKVLTNLSGAGFSGLNFLKLAQWGTDVDAPTWTGNVSLAEDILLTEAGFSISIAPDVETSPANVDDADDYAPLIDGMRRIRWFETTARLNGTDASEHKVFDGYVVDVSQQAGLTLAVSDLGHRLVIAQIKDERSYGSTAGTLIETVIQEIIDNTLGVGVVTLVVDPALAGIGKVKVFLQDRVRLMEAIRSLAQNTIGANVRYMWNDAGEMELRLFMPPRSKTIADFTYSADNYEAVPAFKRNTDDIRNIGRLYYQDTDKKSVVFVSGRVQESIDRYFERYFEFKEIATKNVNSESEAQTMLNAALSDLALPKAEKSFTTQFAWPFDIHDLFTMTANGKQYTTNQSQFVTRISHTLGPAAETRTQFDTRGTIAGFSSRWLIQEGEGPRPPNENILTVGDGLTGEGTMYGGELFNNVTNGCVWLFLKIGPNIKRIHIWARNNAGTTAVPEWPPTGSQIYKAVTFERPEGKIPREGNYTYGPGVYEGRRVWSIIVPVPTDTGILRTVIVKAETEGGSFGPEQRFSVIAADSGSDPGGFVSIDIERIDATTVQITYEPEDETGATLFFRDGVMIDSIIDSLVAPGVKTWLDEELHANKKYLYQAVRISSGQSGPRFRQSVDAWATSLTFANDTPELDLSTGTVTVRIEAAGLPGGTDMVQIQKSVDSGHYDQWAVAATVAPGDFPYHDLVVVAGQFYRLVALDVSGDVLEMSQPAYWIWTP